MSYILPQNPLLDTFVILKQTPCVKQINDKKFESLNKFVKAGDLYSGIIVCKNSQYYLEVGYNRTLGCTVLIPVNLKSDLNVARYLNFTVSMQTQKLK
jgi:hypothetical protein